MHTTRNPLLISIGLLTAILPTTCLFMSVNILFFIPLVVGLGGVVAGCFKMSEADKRSTTVIGLFLCVTAAVGPFALAAYANRSGYPIRIVITAGHRGEFSIVKHRGKGEDLRFQDGAWLFEIPANGVLVVNDDYPFYMWHKARYVYSDGRPARVESLGVTAGNIQTGPNSSRSSTAYDRTTHRWKVNAP
jgi:hypothetical protein